MDAGFEVAVARQDRGGHQVVLHHSLLDLGVERTGVADAGGAAVADSLEAQLVEVGLQTGLVQVVGDHPAARSQRRLHRRVELQALLNGLLGQQARGQHDRGVGGVGAAGDGGNEHRAMSDVRAMDLGADRREVFGLLAEATLGHRLAERSHEAGLEVLQLDAVLRALRSGHAGHHGGEVELDHLRVFDLPLLRHAPQALGLVVVLVEGDLLLSTARGAEVVDAFVIDGEEAHGRAVFGGHVGDGGAVHQRQRGGARAEELHEFADDLGLAEHLRDGQRHIGGGDALTDRAGQMHAHDIGGQEIHRLAQHARLGLDATHAPAHDAQAIDHGGVGIGAHERVGIVDAASTQNALGEVLEVDLMDDANARGNDLEGVEGLHAPLEELVALAVAGELQIEVLLQRVTGAGEIHLH